MAHEHTFPPGHFHHLEPETAYHSAKLGMWLFLATEVLLFGGLFCGYAIFHHVYYDMFHEGSKSLNPYFGGVNTVVLLVSSFFMAWAVDAAQHGNNRAVISRLNVTLICGLIFMVIKAIEYSIKIEHGLFPPPNIFYGLYFTMTGLHGIHVLAGMGAVFWAQSLARKQMYSEAYYTPVEVVGLYWHLVDLIWIYLFPLLYLIG